MTEIRIVELENNWKRALADYKNLERRTAEDKEAFFNFSNETLIRCLLPIIDNMETLSKHVSDEGLNMIVKDFQQILKSEGVRETETTNTDFDPEVMEAVETVEGENNKVVETLTNY
jgi:molecular chaperone GrpE